MSILYPISTRRRLLSPHFQVRNPKFHFPRRDRTSPSSSSFSSSAPMDSSRSKSTSGGNWQIEGYGNRGPAQPPSGLYDYRSDSTYSYSGYGSKGVKEKAVSSSSAASSSKKSSWALSDPDFQRRKRVASYKAYAVEGRMKGSLRRSFRWLKDRYNKMLYGWW